MSGDTLSRASEMLRSADLIADLRTLGSLVPRLLRQSGFHRELLHHPGALPTLLRQAARGLRGPALLLRLHAMLSGSRPALVSITRRLSYRELDLRVGRLAAGLARAGVGPGDRVALFLHNGHEFIESTLAAQRLDATAVQVGYRLKAREVAYVLAHSGARALLFDPELEPVVAAARALSASEVGVAERPALAEQLPHGRCYATGEGAKEEGFGRYEALVGDGGGGQVGAEDAGLPVGGYGGFLLYTSGTTGRAKGAHRDLRQTSLVAAAALMAELPLYRDDRHLVACPLYHAAGSSFAAMVMGIGGCLVLPPRFDADSLPALIERERVTSSVMVPTMLARLCALPEEALRRRDLSSLRWLLSVAAPLPTEVARRVEARLGPILFNMYGATETGLVTLARPGEHTARPGTIGRRLFGNEIRILDAAGAKVADGEVGEIYVRNGTLVSGYHDDRGATAAAQREGFFTVGDLGYRDADGYYYLADRKSDMVISAGVNIYPWEIEQRLHAHPQVADCAVIGVPDLEWGEALLAFVVLRPEAADEAADEAALAKELRDFIGAELADFKRPRRFQFIDSVPRSPTGKIDKRALRERAAAG